MTDMKNMKKKIGLGGESKIGECHVVSYGLLRFRYKHQVRKFYHFATFTFRVMNLVLSVLDTPQLREK